MPNFTV